MVNVACLEKIAAIQETNEMEAEKKHMLIQDLERFSPVLIKVKTHYLFLFLNQDS